MLTSFAITLLALNRGVRRCHSVIPAWTVREKSIVFAAGVLGGIMSGLVGNGIDISVFATMVLLFRISEKVATPTSVILMAFNAVVGFTLQVFVFQDFTNPVLSYWLGAIPVVVVGAPLGAMFCSKLSRQTIANVLIGLIFYRTGNIVALGSPYTSRSLLQFGDISVVLLLELLYVSHSNLCSTFCVTFQNQLTLTYSTVRDIKNIRACINLRLRTTQREKNSKYFTLLRSLSNNQFTP